MKQPVMEANQVCDLHFGQVGIVCVRVRVADAAVLCQEVHRRVATAPAMFARAGVILDLSHLSVLPDDGMVDALLEAIREADMLPVGLAYGTAAIEALARRMGLPVIAKFRAQYEPQAVSAASQAESSAPPAPASSTAQSAATPAPEVEGALHHEGFVRSGQQVYARGRDLLVNGGVATTAEVIADGHIHVYGPLRGRAMAGAQGNAKARIFISNFQAELVAIAGHYRVFEQLPQELAGHAVQCWLEGERLHVTRL